jgi:hypothetical protein
MAERKLSLMGYMTGQHTTIAGGVAASVGGADGTSTVSMGNYAITNTDIPGLARQDESLNGTCDNCNYTSGWTSLGTVIGTGDNFDDDQTAFFSVGGGLFTWANTNVGHDSVSTQCFSSISATSGGVGTGCDNSWDADGDCGWLTAGGGTGQPDAATATGANVWRVDWSMPIGDNCCKVRFYGAYQDGYNDATLDNEGTVFDVKADA